MEQLDRFRSALRSAPVVLFAQDGDLRYTWVHNPTFGSAEQMIGKRDDDLFPAPSAAALTRIKSRVLRTGVAVRQEVRLEAPTGTHHFDLTVEPTFHRDGQVSGVAGTAVDITARVSAELAQQQSVERLRLAQDAAGMGIHEFDVRTGRLQWDARVRELWGLGPHDEPTYDVFMAALHPDDRAPTQAAVDRALDPGGDGHYIAEYRVIGLRDRVERWIAATGHVLFEHGRAVRLIGTVQDVSAGKRGETALRASEARLRALFDQALAGFAETDLTGRFRRVNPRYCAIVGRPASVLYGMRMQELTHPDDLPRNLERFERAVATGEPFVIEKRYVRPDGSIVWVSNSVSVVCGDDGLPSGLVAATIDVTANKEAEQAVRASEERFRIAADAVNGIIYEYDPHTGRVERTRGLAEVVGYAVDEVPPTAAWWWEQIHPDDRRGLSVRAHASLPDRSTTEYRVRHKDGRWLHVEDRAVVMRDASGHVVRMIGCTVDITDQKRAEDVLREADRKKDEFLATLAHELRNPLAPIGNAVQILMMQEHLPPHGVWARDLIDRQVRVMARLLDDLLDVSRITRDQMDLRREPTDLAEVIRAAIETSRPLIEAAGHRLTVQVPDEPVLIEADPVRLAQVLANLLNNAAKYTDPGGLLRLHVDRHGRDVLLAVSDNGIGIAADMMPHLFEIFAQARPALERAQGGLGIGLALVRRIVELHGGTIEAFSAGPGCGSTFTVRLPLVAPSVSALRPRGHWSATAGNR